MSTSTHSNDIFYTSTFSSVQITQIIALQTLTAYFIIKFDILFSKFHRYFYFFRLFVRMMTLKRQSTVWVSNNFISRTFCFESVAYKKKN